MEFNMVYRASIPLEEVELIHQSMQACLDLPEWQQSNYLKLMHGRLAKIANDLQESINDINASHNDVVQTEGRAHPDEQLIFISVYSAFGKMIESWERVIINLPKQYVSRPIYLHEKDAQYAARFKGVLQNEAYVSVWVKKTDIIDTGMLKDKFNRTLISLKDKAINLANIEYFWNVSIRYKWQNTQLIRDKQVTDLSSDDNFFS